MGWQFHPVQVAIGLFFFWYVQRIIKKYVILERQVDTETMQVEVEAGMTVKHLNEYLQRRGLALSVYAFHLYQVSNLYFFFLFFF